MATAALRTAMPKAERPLVRLAAATTAPEPVLPAAWAALHALEARLRAADGLRELQILLAHDGRAIGARNGEAFDRIMVLENAGRRWRVVAATGAATVDARAPAARWLADLVREKIAEHVGEDAVIGPFSITEEGAAPPSQAVLLLLRRGHEPLGAALFLSAAQPAPMRLTILAQLADTAGHAWAFHAPLQRRLRARALRLAAAALATLAAASLTLIPVPMTALAPARIVPTDPIIVAAPVDGVIDDILVKPNDAVASGAPLLRYVDLPLVTRAETAARELAVAEAKLKRTGLVALTSADARRELAIMEAERDLKRAERDFAADQLARSRVQASGPGVALFGDRRDFVGKPVTTGERIMELGDPTRVEVQLELPVEDAVAMAVGQRVSVFLDTAPLSPIAAEVTRINHEPRMIEGRGLAFVIHARIADGGTAPLGVRGAGHIRGGDAPLGLFLFRRPISSLRQWAGI